MKIIIRLDVQSNIKNPTKKKLREKKVAKKERDSLCACFCEAHAVHEYELCVRVT